MDCLIHRISLVPKIYVNCVAIVCRIKYSEMWSKLKFIQLSTSIKDNYNKQA